MFSVLIVEALCSWNFSWTAPRWVVGPISCWCAIFHAQKTEFTRQSGIGYLCDLELVPDIRRSPLANFAHLIYLILARLDGAIGS